MFKILFGFLLGCAFTLTAMDPHSAKLVTSKVIDQIHESYVTGAKEANLPVPGTVDTMSEVAPTVASPEPEKAPVVDATPAAPPVPPVPNMK